MSDAESVIRHIGRATAAWLASGGEGRPFDHVDIGQRLPRLRGPRPQLRSVAYRINKTKPDDAFAASPGTLLSSSSTSSGKRPAPAAESNKPCAALIARCQSKIK
jgi:hypothetical protein